MAHIPNMITPDNFAERPNLAVLFSSDPGAMAAEATKTWAWLKYLWTGPNPNIAIDYRVIHHHTKLSAKTIYETMVTELDKHRLPGVKFGQQILHESGPFSAYRAYLSIRREFDEYLVCAAPVGESYILTVRKIDHFPHIKWFHYLPFFAMAGGLLLGGLRWDGWLGGLIVVALGVALLWSLFRYAAHATVNWFTQHLPYIPFVGHVYMRWFLPDTFYREDLHGAFLTIADQVIRAVIDDLDPEKALRPSTVPITGPVHPDLRQKA